MRLPRARPLREPEERDAPASSRRLHCRTARPPGTHGACPAPRALPGANPFPAGPQLRSPGVGGGVGRAGGAPEPRGLTRVVLQRCWRPGMPALPEPGLRGGGEIREFWSGLGWENHPDPIPATGRELPPHESPSEPLLSPSLVQPRSCPHILGWSSTFQDLPSHPKSAGSCPNARVLQANTRPGAGTGQVTAGGHQ